MCEFFIICKNKWVKGYHNLEVTYVKATNRKWQFKINLQEENFRLQEGIKRTLRLLSGGQGRVEERGRQRQVFLVRYFARYWWTQSCHRKSSASFLPIVGRVNCCLIGSVKQVTAQVKTMVIIHGICTGNIMDI